MVLAGGGYCAYCRAQSRLDSCVTPACCVVESGSSIIPCLCLSFRYLLGLIFLLALAFIYWVIFLYFHAFALFSLHLASLGFFPWSRAVVFSMARAQVWSCGALPSLASHYPPDCDYMMPVYTSALLVAELGSCLPL